MYKLDMFKCNINIRSYYTDKQSQNELRKGYASLYFIQKVLRGC